MMSKQRAKRVQSVVGLSLLLVGGILGSVALTAEFLGLDFTPGFGMVQMFQLLLALTSLTIAGFLFLQQLRPDDAPRSLQADIGIRLAATGLVFSFISGLSDLIGIGTHVEANDFARPFVGPLQLGGIAVVVISILVGMFLYHTSRGSRGSSSLDFLHNGENGEREADDANVGS
jgi:hypothetical protein